MQIIDLRIEETHYWGDIATKPTRLTGTTSCPARKMVIRPARAHDRDRAVRVQMEPGENMESFLQIRSPYVSGATRVKHSAR